jgi:hypothetical protein
MGIVLLTSKFCPTRDHVRPPLARARVKLALVLWPHARAASCFPPIIRAYAHVHLSKITISVCDRASCKHCDGVDLYDKACKVSFVVNSHIIEPTLICDS